MRFMIKRIWMSMRWRGALQCVVLILTIVVLALPGTTITPGVWSREIVVLTGVFMLFVTMLGYRKTRNTSPCEEVLPPLVASTDDFCLILRPFGSDGGIIVNAPRKTRSGRSTMPGTTFRQTLTLEQVIAQAAKRVLGQKTYAMVDQDMLLAPPGPLYMRAPHQDWQHAVTALIQRAYGIFIVLPANQELRDSFSWEIDQIIAHDLQHRTVVIVPPHDPDPRGFENSIRHAAVLAATMESGWGKMADTDPLSVLHYETMLTEKKAIVMKFARNLQTWEDTLEFWVPVDPPGKKRKILPRKFEVNASTYSGALDKALAVMRNELAGTSFADRYPVTLTPTEPLAAETGQATDRPTGGTHI
jgi:hypothetical protein